MKQPVIPNTSNRAHVRIREWWACATRQVNRLAAEGGNEPATYTYPHLHRCGGCSRLLHSEAAFCFDVVWLELQRNSPCDLRSGGISCRQPCITFQHTIPGAAWTLLHDQLGVTDSIVAATHRDPSAHQDLHRVVVFWVRRHLTQHHVSCALGVARLELLTRDRDHLLRDGPIALLCRVRFVIDLVGPHSGSSRLDRPARSCG